MQISADLVDWDEVSQRSAAGTLGDDLIEEDPALEAAVESAYDSCWRSDSANEYLAVAEALQAMLPHTSESNRALCSASLARLVNPDMAQWQELPQELDPENWMLALSPATAREVASKFNAIDYSEFEALFEAHCPASERDMLSDYEADFLSYVIQWKTLFDTASEQGKGVLVHIG